MLDTTKAKLKKIGAYVGLIIVVLAIIVMFFLGFFIKHGVQQITPLLTKTSATLGKCFVFPPTGYFNMHEFTLGNPEGFDAPHSIKFNDITVRVSVPSVLSDVIIVDEVTIDGGDITVQQGLLSNNLTTILGNLESFVKTEKEEESKETPEEIEKKGGKKICIRKLTISNTTIGFSLKGMSSRAPIPLPSITLENIGATPQDDGTMREDGVTLVDAIAEVLESIITGSLEAVKNIDVSGMASGAADATSNAVSGATDAATNAASGAADAASDAVSGATDAIGNLFGGSKK